MLMIILFSKEFALTAC